MGISFDANGEVTIAPPRKEFDAKLKLIVKAFLNDDNFDTRTDPENVLGEGFKSFKAKAVTPISKPSGPPSVPPPPAAPWPVPGLDDTRLS
jgi:hypothetical protein